MASALTEALSYDSTHGKCARLEELYLRGNDLSVSSLKALAPVLSLSCCDLKDLDLSDNAITVETGDEIASWVAFLTSFEKCCTLRRIDIGGNPLGPKAFEVLYRMYAQEGPLNLDLPSELEPKHLELQNQSEHSAALKMSKLSVVSEHEDCDNSFDGTFTSHKRQHSRPGNFAISYFTIAANKDIDSKSPEKASAIEVQINPLSLFATTKGLRSVPYLVVCNTTMTDTCALYLSYIVEAHHTPNQLLPRVPQVKAGVLAQQIQAYDESHCRGIIYHSNQQLSNAGLKVLELAEKRRDHHRGRTDTADSESVLDLSEANKSARRASGSSSKGTVITGSKRRRSTPTGSLDLGGEGADLDRARSRIQGDTLQEAGPYANDLWKFTLRLLVLCRDVQPQNQLRPASAKSLVKPPIVKTLTIPGVSKPKTLKPLTPLVAEKDPNQPLSPWNVIVSKKNEDIPPTPTIIPPTPFTPKADIESLKGTNENIQSSNNGKNYRSVLPCGFSEYTWAKTLAYVAGAHSILSTDQQLSVLRYAVDRSTLGKEREALGLTFATQIWRILEATGSLAYEMDF